MRGFSEHTKYAYLNRIKHIMKYFGRPIEEVTMDKVINKKQLPMYRKKFVQC